MSQNPVFSENEWDPLEEVILGHVAGAAAPPYHIVLDSMLPEESVEFLKNYDEPAYSKDLLDKAEEERQNFIKILKEAGIIIREPEYIDFTKDLVTPYWKSRGLSATCPRDSLLIVGDEIIEAPMSWRCRYNETLAYRKILNEYFEKGAKWTSAPKPHLQDSTYDYNYQVPKPGEEIKYVTTEEEILFDAADFMRFGKDILALRSNTTNEKGIQWLERHLEGRYRIHRVKSHFRQPMHLDDHMMPLAPGKLMISPEYIKKEELPEFLQKWDILVAPKPDLIEGQESFQFDSESLTFFWLNINVLSLDHKRVVAEASQVSTIRALEKWGFEPIPCDFFHYAQLGGLFHCSTVDVRRKKM